MYNSVRDSQKRTATHHSGGGCCHNAKCNPGKLILMVTNGGVKVPHSPMLTTVPKTNMDPDVRGVPGRSFSCQRGPPVRLNGIQPIYSPK